MVSLALEPPIRSTLIAVHRASPTAPSLALPARGGTPVVRGRPSRCEFYLKRAWDEGRGPHGAAAGEDEIGRCRVRRQKLVYAPAGIGDVEYTTDV